MGCCSLLRDMRRPTPSEQCYWMNWEAQQRGLGGQVFCLNTAIEATSLNSRSFCSLLAQDKLIHDHITSQDYLVVSIGGNECASPVTALALRP